MVSPISFSRICEAVKVSKSMREFLGLLGLCRTNGNYLVYHRMLQEMKIDVSHWNIYRSDNGGNHPKIDLGDILIEGSKYRNNTVLKKRLIDAGLVKEACDLCGMAPFWNGKKLILVLDHVNGNSSDHRIENLRLLCPNCNSQQETFCRSRGSKLKPVWECSACKAFFNRRQLDNELKCRKCRKAEIAEQRKITVICPMCGGKKCKKGKLCKKCSNKERAFNHPQKKLTIAKDDLSKMVWEMSTEQVGKELGVSGKAVEKRCKKLGIEKPPRGYWAKKYAEQNKSQSEGV